MGAHEQTGWPPATRSTSTTRHHQEARANAAGQGRRSHAAHAGARRADGPVFLTYRASAGGRSVAARVTSGQPLFDFTAPDGVRHTLWRVGGADRDALVGGVRSDSRRCTSPTAIIAPPARPARAPRCATRSAPADARRRRRRNDHAGSGVSARPGADLAVQPGRQGSGGSVAGAIPRGGRASLCIAAARRRRPGAATSPCTSRAVADAPTAPGARPVRSHRARWTSACCRIGCSRRCSGSRMSAPTNASILSAAHAGTSELEKGVDRGRAAVAFSLYPVSVADLMAVSDADEIMPPKSTWFEPKLRDGLLIHVI